MLDFGVEYRYADICEAFGWKQTTGAARQRQLNAVLQAYSYYQPINPATNKKLRGVYVFDRKIGDPVLEDGRKTNGHKSNLSDEEFEVLFSNLVSECMTDEDKLNGEGKREVLVFTSEIFRSFGADIYKALSSIDYKRDRFAESIFRSIVIGAAKGYTITKISRTLGFGKNGLPKTVVVYDPGQFGTYRRSDDLAIALECCFAEVLDDYFIDGENEAIRRGFYYPLLKVAEERLGEEKGLIVRRINVLPVPDKDYSVDTKRVVECQARFKETIINSVMNSIANRVEGKRKYTADLSDRNEEHLKMYANSFFECLNDGSCSNQWSF